MLAAENLTLARDGKRILDRVSLAIHPGEVVGLLAATVSYTHLDVYKRQAVM